MELDGYGGMREGKPSSEYNKKNIFNKKFKAETKRKKLLRTVYFQGWEHKQYSKQLL